VRVPLSGASSSDSMRISVDLPDPFGPTSAMRSPRSMWQRQIPESVSGPYALCACVSSSTVRPLLRQVGKREVDPLSFGRHLDRNDLLEHLDAALYLRGFGRLVAEPVDEHLHARDFFVLLLLRLPQPLEHRVALRDVFAVVADVVRQLAQIEIRDARDDLVEEVAVVGDENHREGIRAEIFLEPVARLEVEMVRRLVEQQQIRASEQQLGERDAHLPSAGKCFRGRSHPPD